MILRSGSESDEQKGSSDARPSSRSSSKQILEVSAGVARFISRHPCLIIISTIGFSVTVSLLTFFVSDYQLASENKKGWKSRGTTIGMRGMQDDLIRNYRDVLFHDSIGDEWEYLTTTVVEGYVDVKNILLRPINLDPEDRNSHQKDGSCDTSWYSSPNILVQDNLYALWKAVDGMSILHPMAIQDICIAEEKTMTVIRENNLCGSCSSNTGIDCLQPLSLVFVLKQYLSSVEENVEDMSCAEIASAYANIESSFTQKLIQCVDELRASVGHRVPGNTTVCPSAFSPQLVDKDFGMDGNTLLTHSTSHFHTADSDVFKLFSARGGFGYGSDESITAVYDTNTELFNEFTIDEYVVSDLVLATISGLLAFIVIAVHTGSLWLVLLGSLQITFAIPLSYFVYRFIFGIRFFSLLNFTGFFVSTALGADDLFVASDKWKAHRLKYPKKSTEDIAALVLPEAGFAMMMTTFTTSTAFFATCVSPVAPIFCFAVFCGLMVMLNYILNCALVFPGLCLYDGWLMKQKSANCFVSCRWCRGWGRGRVGRIMDKTGKEDESVSVIGDEMIRRMQRRMEKLYGLIHIGRWVILIACLIGLSISVYFAQTISSPENMGVRLLSASHPLEKMAKDRNDLLSSYLRDISTGSPVDVHFGVKEKDTGNYSNPDTLSTLELDDTFDPSANEAQQYLFQFCDRLFKENFAYKPYADYECSINRFSDWLENQSLLPQTERAPDYNNKCKGASSIPMSEVDFHPCFIYWSQLESDLDVLQWDGKVRILTVHAGTRLWVNAPPFEVQEVWEEFELFKMKEENIAPSGVNKWFHTSGLWWLNDTYRSMMQTGISSLYIAISFTFVLTLVSSRSIVCSIVSATSIFFILAASTASLVGLVIIQHKKTKKLKQCITYIGVTGWDLGFIETICFAIVIGISADFVIHLSHSYTHIRGSYANVERTRYALVYMGPSILGATITTLMVAFMMLFCEVIFFIKFAQLLIVTICFSLLGSFVFYIVIMDIVGPATPTKTIDTIASWFKRKK